MEKETLEEAAYRLSAEKFEPKHIGFMLGVIEGTKWQSERMYSEEEVKSAFKNGFNIGYGSPVQDLDLKNEHCEKWFEQFKKK